MLKAAFLSLRTNDLGVSRLLSITMTHLARITVKRTGLSNTVNGKITLHVSINPWKCKRAYTLKCVLGTDDWSASISRFLPETESRSSSPQEFSLLIKLSRVRYVITTTISTTTTTTTTITISSTSTSTIASTTTTYTTSITTTTTKQ
jgi:hypothetical protein